MNSVNVINNVLEYKGWLYLFEGAQKQFSYLTGALKVNSTVIKNFVSNIKNRSLFLKEAEIPYCHVVFPSKPVVNNRKQLLSDKEK